MSTVDPSAAHPQEPKPRKIVLVDDNVKALSEARLALEGAGFHVVTLENPLTLPSVIRRERPDLVLVDLEMPAVSGDVVAQIVTQHKTADSPPVVLCSDSASPDLEARAKKCGASGFLRIAGAETFVQDVRRFLPPMDAAG